MWLEIASSTQLNPFAFQAIIAGAYDLYCTVCAHLKPSPQQPHYIFSLHDINRIMQVRCSAGKKKNRKWRNLHNAQKLNCSYSAAFGPMWRCLRQQNFTFLKDAANVSCAAGAYCAVFAMRRFVESVWITSSCSARSSLTKTNWAYGTAQANSALVLVTEQCWMCGRIWDFMKKIIFSKNCCRVNFLQGLFLMSPRNRGRPKPVRRKGPGMELRRRPGAGKQANRFRGNRALGESLPSCKFSTVLSNGLKNTCRLWGLINGMLIDFTNMKTIWALLKHHKIVVNTKLFSFRR